jgi:GTPase SAR1 family protein
MNDTYIRTGDIFCLVFSIDNLQSFEDMLIQLKNIIKLKGNKPIIVIGNKTDESARQVGHAWADLILSCDYNVKYIETSAKYNVNIDTVRLAALSLAKDNGHVVLANVANSVVACPMVAKSKSPSNLRRMISRLRGILQNYQ